VITGDDILIEYVSRVVSLLRQFDDEMHDEQELSGRVRNSILKFVSHHVWQKAGAARKLWAQMESRMTEMLDRRRRLLKYNIKKERENGEPSLDEERTYQDLVAKKHSVVSRFSHP